jgi:hypothetical protein
LAVNDRGGLPYFNSHSKLHLRSERKTPPKNTLKSGTFKGLSRAQWSERESNAFRSDAAAACGPSICEIAKSGQSFENWPALELLEAGRVAERSGWTPQVEQTLAIELAKS